MIYYILIIVLGYEAACLLAIMWHIRLLDKATNHYTASITASRLGNLEESRLEIQRGDIQKARANLFKRRARYVILPLVFIGNA